MSKQTEFPFSWKTERRTKKDYGTPYSLVCNACEATVFTGSHAARPVDRQYFYHYAARDAQRHLAIAHQEAQ